MNATREPQESADTLLARFLSAEDAAAQQHLERLLSEYAEPIIRKITRFKLRPYSASSLSHNLQDEADVRGDIVLQLITCLQDLRKDRSIPSIQNFLGYVAGIAYNLCNMRFRSKYPARWRLKNRLRYLLNHRPDFTLWENPHKEWLCGLAIWGGTAAAKEIPEEAHVDLDNFVQALPPGTVRQMKPEEVIHALLSWRGSPLALDELVRFTAELWGIHDPQPMAVEYNSSGYESTNICELLPDPSMDAFSQMEQRIFLERLWKEICELPLRQRAALLLNLRDAYERDALILFELTGTASLSQIAGVLDRSPEAFYELWNELPLDDLSIAKLLDLSRQQVINLRKSAKERLVRRMRAYGSGTEAKSGPR